MTIALDSLVSTAFQTVTTLGLAPAVTLTRPPAVNGKTGATTGSAQVQTARAVELTPAQFRRYPGEAWQTATLGLLFEARSLTWAPSLRDTCTWAGHTYRIVAVERTAPQGSDLLLAVGLAR